MSRSAWRPYGPIATAWWLGLVGLIAYRGGWFKWYAIGLCALLASPFVLSACVWCWIKAKEKLAGRRRIVVLSFLFALGAAAIGAIWRQSPSPVQISQPAQPVVLPPAQSPPSWRWRIVDPHAAGPEKY
jgi:hypothetical protein